ncbi:MAG: dolichyl-phosphate beta-glucosyltransferase [Candidatus Woesearchaeota archaeon]
MKKVSIIVPVYNEENRAPDFLNSLIKFCRVNLEDYEILFVNDGSTDNTIEMLKKLALGDSCIKIFTYKENKGKGAAVQIGVFKAEGEKIIFIDADGSIPADEIPKMVQELEEYDVVAGSRTNKDSEVRQPFYRVFSGVSFNIIVNLLFSVNIKDNLCGFKGFKKDAATDLFKDLIDKRWVFDVEVFFKIRKRGYSLKDIPINWVYKTGSKMTLFDPMKMFFRLIVLRLKLMKQ